MLLLKHQLSAALKRECLDLNEKIAILGYANEHPKMCCRKLGVKCFVETHGDKQINVMLDELIGKVETLKLQNVGQSTIMETLWYYPCFLRNEVVS